MPRFLVTCWPDSGKGPALTKEQIERHFPTMSRIITAKDAHQAAVIHGAVCTSDGCLSEEIMGPWVPNIHEAKELLRPLGITIRQRGGEYRVNFVNGIEDTAYYTDDRMDAVCTGLAMAEWRASDGS